MIIINWSLGEIFKEQSESKVDYLMDFTRDFFSTSSGSFVWREFITGLFYPQVKWIIARSKSSRTLVIVFNSKDTPYTYLIVEVY